MPNDVKLIMKFNRTYDCFSITDGKEKGSLFRFPDEQEMKQIWRKICPGKQFKLITPVNVPVRSIQVKVGMPTSGSQRVAFCRELLILCEIVAA